MPVAPYRSRLYRETMFGNASKRPSSLQCQRNNLAWIPALIGQNECATGTDVSNTVLPWSGPVPMIGS